LDLTIRTRSNLTCWFLIGRLRIVGGAGGGGRPPAASRGGGVEPDFTKTVFPGLIRAGFGSGRDYATRVVHLGPLRASGRSVAVRATTAAGLHGLSRRRACMRAVLGSKPSTKGSWCVRGAKANPSRE